MRQRRSQNFLKAIYGAHATDQEDELEGGNYTKEEKENVKKDKETVIWLAKLKPLIYHIQTIDFTLIGAWKSCI